MAAQVEHVERDEPGRDQTNVVRPRRSHTPNHSRRVDGGAVLTPEIDTGTDGPAPGALDSALVGGAAPTRRHLRVPPRHRHLDVVGHGRKDAWLRTRRGTTDH